MVASPLFISKVRAPSGRSRPSVWVLQLVFALVVPCALGQPPVTDAAKVILIDLQRYGWERLPPPIRHEAWPTEARLMNVDSQGRVVIGYPVRGEGLATRESSRLKLRIIRFTPEGKLDLATSLTTDSLSNNEVWLDAQDHILAIANQSLQMLAGYQASTQASTWRVLTSCSWFSESCRIVRSPTRRKMFVIRCLDPKPNCPEPASTAYDTSSSEPQELKSCAWRRGSITDVFGYLWGWDRGYFFRRYSLCDPASPESKLPVGEPVSAALSDDLFVTAGVKKRWEIGVVTSNGNTKFRLQLPKHESPALSITYVKGDATGDRVALVLDTLQGGSAALDIGKKLVGRRVVVYESDSGAQLTSLSIYPPVPHYGVALAIVPGFAFDISPNGHVLAVLSEGILRIAKID
jgi:hypothetical protein